MTTALSVRIGAHTKTQLEILATRARRSKSFLGAEAIAAFVDAQSWQLDQTQEGLKEPATVHIGRPGCVPGSRELIVSGTPDVIPYRVRGERLEIIAVFHGRQRWPKRFGL